MTSISSLNQESSEKFLSREQAAKEILASETLNQAVSAGTSDFIRLMQAETHKSGASNIQHDIEAVQRLQQVMKNPSQRRAHDGFHENKFGDRITHVRLEDQVSFGQQDIPGLKLQITAIDNESRMQSGRNMRMSPEQILLEQEGTHRVDITSSLAMLTSKRELVRYNECGISMILNKEGQVIGMHGVSTLGNVPTYTLNDITSEQTDAMNLKIDTDTLKLIQEIQ